MSADPTTVETRTTTTVAAGDDEPHDGVIPEPARGFSNVLWLLVVVVLCLSVLALVAAIVLLAFTPGDPAPAADAATLVAVLGSVLTALVGFYSARQRR